MEIAQKALEQATPDQIKTLNIQIMEGRKNLNPSENEEEGEDF